MSRLCWAPKKNLNKTPPPMPMLQLADEQPSPPRLTIEPHCIDLPSSGGTATFTLTSPVRMAFWMFWTHKEVYKCSPKHGFVEAGVPFAVTVRSNGSGESGRVKIKYGPVCDDPIWLTGSAAVNAMEDPQRAYCTLIQKEN